MSGSDGLLIFGGGSQTSHCSWCLPYFYEKRAPHIWEILHVYQKGINPYSFLKKKRRHLITLLNVLYKITSGCLSYSTCFKIFDMKDSVWPLHRRTDYISLCYTVFNGNTEYTYIWFPCGNIFCESFRFHYLGNIFIKL